MPITISYDIATGHLVVDGTDFSEAITRYTDPSILQIGMKTSEMSGFGGNDYLRGGFGMDLIHGDDGNDSLDGEENSDDVHGGANNDTVTTRYNGLDESIYGDSGNDTLQFTVVLDRSLTPVAATIDGGADHDLLRVQGTGLQSSLLIDLQAGLISDIRTTVQYASVTGIEDVTGVSSDRLDIRGDGKDNKLTASVADDKVAGGGGDDLLVGEKGGDTLSGNAGNDTLYDGAYEDVSDPFTNDMSSDTLYGGADNDLLFSYAGDDSLFGGSGDDILVGIAGNDVLNGGGGDDDIVFRLPGAYRSEIAFPKRSLLEDPYFLITRNPTDFSGLDINGGPGTDTVWFDGLTSVTYDNRGAIHANLERGVARISLNTNQPKFDMKNIENLYGTDQNDRVIGSNGGNTIVGGNGDDRIAGLDGNDYLYGDQGKDKIFGGSGSDRVYGNKDADLLKGGSGQDTVRGGDGNDKLWGNANRDTISGGAGDDRLKGGDSRDELYGGKDHDWLFGGDGRDFLEGGRGSDTLVGGEANDFLTGGDGSDTFVFRLGSGIDTIIQGDFNDRYLQDLIDLRGLGLSSFGKLNLIEVSPGEINLDIEGYSRGGTLLLLPTIGDGVFLEGTTIKDLDANDFVF